MYLGIWNAIAIFPPKTHDLFEKSQSDFIVTPDSNMF